MLTVILNEEGFEYDIHSLVKAFYPLTEVKVFVKGTKEIVSDGKYPVLELIRSSETLELLLYPCVQDWEQAKCGIRQLVHCSKEQLPLSEKKSRIRNEIKQLLYRVLSEYTGKTLPWGTLTGIRPTKIAMELLEKRKTESEIQTYMQKQYYADEEKSRLSVEIAKRERELLADIHYQDGYSLYIGIPFCPTTCLYCSFTSYPICVWKERVADYLSAMEKEMKATAEIFGDKVLDSVYIGGGTPTTLDAMELERLLKMLHETFDLSGIKEFTVEAGRADSITEDKLCVLKQYGVTRISVNPQTMKEETLKLIGRQHTVEQVVDSFKLARKCGFDNINMDLILGLPGETEADVKNTTEAVKELKPDSLTVHSLAIKKGSRLNQWILENGITAIQNTDEMMRIAAQAAAELGMQPYYLYRQKNISGNFENVGYARQGCYGLYNILIMEEKQSIVALGAGSISKRVYQNGRIERCDNVKDVALYIEKIDEMIERKRKLFEA